MIASRARLAVVYTASNTRNLSQVGRHLVVAGVPYRRHRHANRLMGANHPGFETRVRESFGRQAFMRTLGATLQEVGEGRTTIRLPRDATLSQQHGYVHAGALIAVLDSACGYAALSVAAPGSEVLTAELKVNLLAPAAGTTVIAHGRVVRAGRTLSVCQGDAYDVEDPSKHLATMLATMVVVVPKPVPQHFAFPGDSCSPRRPRE